MGEFRSDGITLTDVMQWNDISAPNIDVNNTTVPKLYQSGDFIWQSKLISYSNAFYRTQIIPRYTKNGGNYAFAKAGWFPTNHGGYTCTANRYIRRNGNSISISVTNSYNSGMKMDVRTGIKGNKTVGTHLINIALQGGGGGGGGGTSAGNSAGGGGAGGFFGGTVYLPDNLSYALIVVGAGGTGNTQNDQDGGTGENTHIELHFTDNSWVPWVATASGGNGGRGGKSTSGQAGQGGGGGTASVGESAYAQAHYLITGARGGNQNNAGSAWTQKDIINIWMYAHVNNISLPSHSGGASGSSNTGGGGGAGAYGNGAAGYHSGVPAAAPNNSGAGGGGGGNAWLANNTGGVGGSGYAQVWY